MWHKMFLPSTKCNRCISATDKIGKSKVHWMITYIPENIHHCHIKDLQNRLWYIDKSGSFACESLFY